MNARNVTALGAALFALGIIAGAFGAHALAARLAPADLAIYQTGVWYHQLNALGLVVIGTWLGRSGSHEKLLRWAAVLVLAGTVIFSGTLYLLVLSGVRVLGAVTPLGGVALITGWGLFAFAIRQALTGRDT